uniref:Putative secreted protein n=1 Tax=Anopheles darlingi TaxID=43151 RepID=A0A2M4D5B1_ANODA
MLGQTVRWMRLSGSSRRLASPALAILWCSLVADNGTDHHRTGAVAKCSGIYCFFLSQAGKATTREH